MLRLDPQRATGRRGAIGPTPGMEGDHSPGLPCAPLRGHSGLGSAQTELWLPEKMVAVMGMGDWGNLWGTVTLDSPRDSLVCRAGAGAGERAEMGHFSTPPLGVTPVPEWKVGEGD